MESLQRIYGISFPDPKMLKEWEKFQEEAKNRDHRKLGRVCCWCDNLLAYVIKAYHSFEIYLMDFYYKPFYRKCR